MQVRKASEDHPIEQGRQHEEEWDDDMRSAVRELVRETRNMMTNIRYCVASLEDALGPTASEMETVEKEKQQLQVEKEKQRLQVEKEKWQQLQEEKEKMRQQQQRLQRQQQETISGGPQQHPQPCQEQLLQQKQQHHRQERAPQQQRLEQDQKREGQLEVQEKREQLLLEQERVKEEQLQLGGKLDKAEKVKELLQLGGHEEKPLAQQQLREEDKQEKQRQLLRKEEQLQLQEEVKDGGEPKLFVLDEGVEEEEGKESSAEQEELHLSLGLLMVDENGPQRLGQLYPGRLAPVGIGTTESLSLFSHWQLSTDGFCGSTYGSRMGMQGVEAHGERWQQRVVWGMTER